MKKLVLFLLLTPRCFSQSPFDGTWVLDQSKPQLPEKPTQYLLNKGLFRCSGCIVNLEVAADGYDHKVGPTDYWDTVNVQALNAKSVEIIVKKDGKTMFTEVDVISEDGSALAQVVKDTTEAETVSTEIDSRRIESGPKGAHEISGSWSAYKTHRSSNGSIIKYKCTEEAFSGETPLGEKFEAKFDGNFYPVEGDPGHTMVAAKLHGLRTVELTHKRNGKIVSISRMTVAPDWSSIHVIFRNKEANTTTKVDFQRQQ